MRKPCKVLHFIESGGLYGAESVILNLSREMLTEGHYVPVIGCIVSSEGEVSDLYEKALECGIAAEKLVIRNSCLLPDLFRASRQLRRIGIDLIHSHGYKPSVFGFLSRFFTGIPIIATCHLWFLQGNPPLKMRSMIKVELFFYKFFPVVVAVSEPIKKILIDHGVPSNKVVVIRNGIVMDDYQAISKPLKEQLYSELKLSPGEVCVLNVGRLNRQKAQWHIITAARKLMDDGCNVKFFIVGEGPLRTELERQIEDTGVRDRVFLLGFRSDVNYLFQLADIFILPSLDEGMPMALLEAAAAGIPVVVTPVGDVPKLIEDGISGLLVDSDDADDLAAKIKKLLDFPELREKLAVNVQNKVRSLYSSAAMYTQYEDVYGKVLGHKVQGDWNC